MPAQTLSNLARRRAATNGPVATDRTSAATAGAAAPAAAVSAPGRSGRASTPPASKAVASSEKPGPEKGAKESRMPARNHQFKVGDKAVYPARGVAEVVSIEEIDIAGNRQNVYVLRILDTEHRIKVPVKNASNVGLRPPISESEIREIFAILKERAIAFDKQTWNRRYRGFVDKINTGSVFDVAEVMRDLYRLRAEKSLSFGERRMLERARDLIVKEIAVARRKSEDKVQAEIEKIFETN
jgi:CarD family transcriptional regulator